MKRRIFFLCAASAKPNLDVETLLILEKALEKHREQPVDVIYIAGRYVPGDVEATAVDSMIEWLNKKEVGAIIKYQLRSDSKIDSEIHTIVSDLINYETSREIVIVDVPYRAERLWYLLRKHLPQHRLTLVDVNLGWKLLKPSVFFQFAVNWAKELCFQIRIRLQDQDA